MVLLKFEQSDYDMAYHAFKDKNTLLSWVYDNYDNVNHIEDTGLILMDFDEIRIQAKIITPVVHEK